MESITGELAPWMFVAALAFIFIGYPVAFSLGAVAILFAIIGIQAGFFTPSLLLALGERLMGTMSNYILLAVPFFVFMGTMLERSRLADDLLKTAGQLFGALRGGLAVAVIIVGTLLAAATGIVGASVVSMGIISLPIMLRYDYDASVASGVITASGTLGTIVPPSIVLIVLADQMGVSVGDMFLGGLLPGLMLAVMYIGYVQGVAFFKPNSVPALPAEERELAPRALAKRVAVVLLPPLVLIFVVLGSIFAGVATPTEAGALGALGAMGLAALNGRLSYKSLKETMERTAELTTMVIFILVGSTAFSLVFRGLYGGIWIENLLLNLPGGVIGFIIVVNIVIFILGFFIDFFEIAFILVPLLAPVAVELDLNLVWFGVMIGMNLQTSFLTPPFGFSLFYLRGVAPEGVTTKSMYAGVIPFIIIQLVGLAAMIAYPELVTWAL